MLTDLNFINSHMGETLIETTGSINSIYIFV
ncbi:MAG: hypothetical protein Ct9H90mP17_0380 [Actinomycetota bacterium]|nr:MAG: hypothetical protein Ct9H90mP17_0380 [Actinomycetota bacterium]